MDIVECICSEIEDGMQVCLTPSHLAIVMEYAAGGELFERICNAGRFAEDEVGAKPWCILLSAFHGLLFLCTSSPFILTVFFSYSSAGQVLLPAVDMWSELLS